MKFSINRTVFTKYLTDVQRAISSRTTIPVLTGIKLMASSDGIVLTGSDSTLSIEVEIPVVDEENQLTIEDTGSIILPSRFLGDIVRRLPDPLLTIESMDNAQTMITSGTAVFNLNGIAGSEYPLLPEIDSKATFTLPANLLKQVIHHTIISVSNQEIRPIFTGIHFTLGEGKLKAVATDSHRLSQRVVPLTMPTEVEEKTLELNIPGRSLSELTRIIEDNEDVEMMVMDNQVLFKIENIYLYSRLLDGNYPDTDRLLPKEYDTVIEIDANTLLSSVERALIMSHQGKNNVVNLKITEESAVLSSHSAEIGAVTEDLKTTNQSGKALSISFNPDYLKEALRSFGNQDIMIRFQSASQPLLLLPSDQSDNFNMVQLITPIRTPGQ